MTLNIVGVNGNIGSGKDTVADQFVAQGYTKVSLADPMKRFAYMIFEFTEEQLWGPSDNRNAWDGRYYEGSKEWELARKELVHWAPDWVEDLLLDPEEPALAQGFAALNAVSSLLKWFDNLRENHPKLSPRVCLQLLGTEWGRETLHENVWVDYMERVAVELLGDGGYSYDKCIGVCVHKHDHISLKINGIVVPDVRFENELLFFRDHDHPVIKVIRPETDSKAVQTGVAQHKSETEQAGFASDLFTVIITNDDTIEVLLDTALRLAEVYNT